MGTGGLQLLDDFGDGFFLLSISNTSTDILEDVSFLSDHLQSFQGPNGKEVRGEECDIGIVIGTSPMVSPPEEGI